MPLYKRFDIHIDFAHRAFIWDSESNTKAHVHCVIIGFSVTAFTGNKLIYTADRPMVASNINSYLLDAPIVFVESRTKPLDYVPQMSSGGKPVEGGHLIFSKDEKEAFLQNEPGAEKFFKRFVGSDDFINGYERWCLWLYNANPKELHGLPAVMKKVEAVRDYRLASSKAATRACAEYPTQFMEIKLPKGQFLIVPEVSSEKRKYIPIGYAQDMICSNLVRYVPEATLFHFGVLTSNVHMAWMRAVCGRLEMRYRYSANVVYNNFPWPKPTDTQKAKIEQTAQAILDARAKYPDCSLAELYDELTMPPELRKAHQQNDKAVMQAYGFWGKLNTETECVAELMKMYQNLTQ